MSSSSCMQTLFLYLYSEWMVLRHKYHEWVYDDCINYEIHKAFILLTVFHVYTFLFLWTHLKNSSPLNTKIYNSAAVATSNIHKAIVFEISPLLPGFSCGFIDVSAWYNLNYDTTPKYKLAFEIDIWEWRPGLVASEFASALKAPWALWLRTMKDHAWHDFLCGLLDFALKE